MTDDELSEPGGDFDDLVDFLESPDAPDDWMPGAVLDGYLTGIAVSPTRLNPSDWMPKIWGDTPFESEAQAIWALAAVMARFNYINQFARGEEPGPLWPRLDSSHPDGGPVVRGWTVGFVKAITLDMEAWRPLLDHEKARVLLDPLFGYVGYRDANGEAVRTDATEAEPDGELAELLPGIVRAIHLFWTEGPPDVRDDDSRIRVHPGPFTRIRSFALNIFPANGVRDLPEAGYATTLNPDALLAYADS